RRYGGRARHCPPLACLGNPPQSALSRLHDAQRRWCIPRFLLVLFHQRASAALSGAALSARLQHCPPAVLLALSPHLAVPVEHVPAGGRKAPIPERGPRQPNAIARALLDRIRAAFLFFFDDPG